MEQIYYYTGLVVLWISASIGVIFTVGYLIKITLNELGRKFKILWLIVEYAHYRKKFKEWVKDKERMERK
jgi:hypothetical protein